MQTILGANGTIGKLLAKELVRYTRDIRLVSRNPVKVNETDQLMPADLTVPANLDKAIAGSKVVYLLVGLDYNIRTWQRHWPPLMRATLDACIKHNAKLVFFDNIYLYDARATPRMTEHAPVNPPSKKGKVRAEIAEMLMGEVRRGKVSALIARAADFYGPSNEKSMLIEMVYKNLKKNKRPNWLGNADRLHSFTYTPDAARATALLGNTPAAYNQVWHLPTDRNTMTAREISTLFSKEMKKDLKLAVLPDWFIRVLGIFIPVMREMPEMMYQYKQDYFFDSSKFESHFKMKPTPYRKGIHETVSGAGV